MRQAKQRGRGGCFFKPPSPPTLTHHPPHHPPTHQRRRRLLPPPALPPALRRGLLAGGDGAPRAGPAAPGIGPTHGRCVGCVCLWIYSFLYMCVCMCVYWLGPWPSSTWGVGGLCLCMHVPIYSCMHLYANSPPPLPQTTKTTTGGKQFSSSKNANPSSSSSSSRGKGGVKAHTSKKSKEGGAMGTVDAQAYFFGTTPWHLSVSLLKVGEGGGGGCD